MRLQEKTDKNTIYTDPQTSFWPSIQDTNSWKLWIRKTNVLLKLINRGPNIGKVFLCPKDSYESKYQYLAKNHKEVGLKHFKDLNTFMECSNNFNDIYGSINEYNQGRNEKYLIVFDGAITDMISNKKTSSNSHWITY